WEPKESSYGSYGDAYFGKTLYDTTSQTWKLSEGTGGGSGGVYSFVYTTVDADAYIGIALQTPRIPHYGEPYLKHYSSGSYNSSSMVSQETVFTSTFSVENGSWKTFYAGTDYDYTRKEYGMKASGSVNYTTPHYASNSQTGTSLCDASRNDSGSEISTTSLRTDWNVIGGTKQTVSSVYANSLTREITEKHTSSTTYSDFQGAHSYSTHVYNRTVNLFVNDITEKDATGAQQRTYGSTIHATENSCYEGSDNYGVNNEYRWYINQTSQNAWMTRTDPLLSYDITNVMTDYTNNIKIPGYVQKNTTATVDYCNMSMAETGVNKYFMYMPYGGTTYVNSVQLQFGAGGAGVKFGGPVPIPDVSGSENFDQFIKRAPVQPMDMTGAFLPQQTPWQAFWGSIQSNSHTAFDRAEYLPIVGTVAGIGNASQYAIEGDLWSAGTSAFFAIPFIGTAAKDAKLVAKGVKVGQQILKHDAVGAAKTVGKQIGKHADDVAKSATKVTSSITDKRLIDAAKNAGKSVQKELDALVFQLQKGNMNPGIGTKHLFNGIFEARAKNGARVYFRKVGDGIEIVGKSDKHNQPQVIAILQRLYEN
ncbi:MAG: hypothetical protein FWD31_14205, partial [Planctomycetaceae bacterium]|nr:hypothetical protein [Planctomycetaceae bacterium]